MSISLLSSYYPLYYLFTICLLSIHNLFTAFHNLFAISLLFVSICLLSIYDLSIIYLLSVYYPLTILINP